MRAIFVSVFLCLAGLAHAQDIAEPFKVGTFEIHGAPTVGIVLQDSRILELDAANAALEKRAQYPAVPMPADMTELIERYEYGLKRRIYEIVNVHVAMRDQGMERPAYVHNVEDVRTLPPIMYPGKILNAAVNFYSHVEESGTEAERQEARRLRREQRGVPYLFLKPSRGAVVGKWCGDRHPLRSQSNRLGSRTRRSDRQHGEIRFRRTTPKLTFSATW